MLKKTASRFRKILPLALALALLFSLAACSSSGAENEAVSPTAPSAEPSEQPSAEPTEVPLEEPTEQAPSFAEGWFIPYNSDSFNLSVADADGSDITERVIELWHGVNSMYCEESEDVFDLGEELVRDRTPVFYELLNYDEAVEEFFTDAGAEQFESDCDATHLIETIDGRRWRIGAWRSGWSCEYSIPDAEVVMVEPDRITLSVNCGDPGSGADRYADFVIAKEGGIWKVESYSYPNLPARCDDDECEYHHG